MDSRLHSLYRSVRISWLSEKNQDSSLDGHRSKSYRVRFKMKKDAYLVLWVEIFQLMYWENFVLKNGLSTSSQEPLSVQSKEQSPGHTINMFMNPGLGVINSKNLSENSGTQVFVVFFEAVGEHWILIFDVVTFMSLKQTVKMK